MRQSMEEVKMLLKARQTCIWIHSIEEVEVIKDIKEIARKDMRNAKLFVWSNTEGVKHIPFVEGESAEPTDIKLREIPALFASIREQLTKDNTCAIYVLRDLHNLTGDPRTRRCIRDIAEYPQNKYVPLIVISPTAEVHSEISHLFKTVEYGLPSIEEISAIVESNNQAVAKKVNGEGRTDLSYLETEEDKRAVINACIGLTAKETKETIFQSLTKHKSFNLSYIVQHKIDAIRKSGLLDYKEPQISLDDVGGHRDLKAYLLEIKEQLTPAARDFGLPMPKGALFLGLAGCGKTMAAEAFAGTLSVPLLSLSMARVMSRFVGESENKIDQALSIVRSTGNCVLLLDEVEKMLGGNC